MNHNELYTIILTHFNQMKFIKEAIDSILKQTYKNIELIITDDASNEFDAKWVKNYIEENKKANIKNIKILVNNKNIGTVKTLNNALKEVNGEYVQFFAADDALYDENVFKNFVKAFKENKEHYIMTSQCLLCGEMLDELKESYINKSKALNLNEKSSFEQFEVLSLGCFYGAGGTAYKKEIFNITKDFDEDFLLVEDWAYWLNITLMGYKIIYCDFISLLHRDGGVSHNTSVKIPPHVKKYYYDILKIMEKYIIFNTKKMTRKNRFYCLTNYRCHVVSYNNNITGLYLDKKPIFKKIYLKNIDYFFNLVFLKIKRKLKFLNKNEYIYFICLLITLLIFNFLQVNYTLALLFSYIIGLIFIYVQKVIK